MQAIRSNRVAEVLGISLASLAVITKTVLKDSEAMPGSGISRIFGPEEFLVASAYHDLKRLIGEPEAQDAALRFRKYLADDREVKEPILVFGSQGFSGFGSQQEYTQQAEQQLKKLTGFLLFYRPRYDQIQAAFEAPVAV